MTDDVDHGGRPGERPIEARLRAALAARAATIDPSPDGLDRIEEELMSGSPNDRNRNRWVIGALSAAAAVVLVLVAVTILDDDDGTDVTADTTTTAADTTTTTESTTTTEVTTTEPFAPEVDPFAVAYPSPTTSQRFDSPESAARSYATEVLGFTELELGEFREGDSRSGEVPISDRPGGPETSVLVRQMADETWFVLGSTVADIQVAEPSAQDAVGSPFETSGTALAFEGTVSVVVLTQDDPGAPIGEGFVTGSGVPPAGPFEGEISFTPPTEDTAGVLVYRTHSAEDGHVQQATSFPVRLEA